MGLRDKRVLVTGGGGFLGSYLCERLGQIDLAELFVPRRADFDLTDPQAVRQLYDRCEPEVVFHLAAEVGGIGANRANPGRYFYANMAMGLNVIEECRRKEVQKAIVAGTVCAYPKHTPVPFKEESLWDGYPEETNAPYGVAKKALLVMLQAYRQQYGLNGIYLLPANLFGPKDNFDLETSHVIPALIRKFVTARDTGASEVEVWGTGSASREFLYADDAARSLVLAAEMYDDPAPVNVGTGQEVTIRRLVGLIAKMVGFEGTVRWNPDRPDGQPRRSLDISRAAEGFGFAPEVSLEEGLRRTIDWWVAESSTDP